MSPDKALPGPRCHLSDTLAGVKAINMPLK